MKLKTKLLLGFMAILAMLTVIAFVGWKSMDTMQRQSRVSRHVEDGLTNLLLAESRQLNYALSRDPSFVQSTLEGIESSHTDLTKAMALINGDDRMAMASQADRALSLYKTELAKVVSGNEAYDRASANLMNATQEIIQRYERVLASATDLLLINFSSKLFTGYVAMQNAYRSFQQARLAARIFEVTPTEQNAKNTLDNFAEAIRNTDAASGLFTMQVNVEHCREIVRLLKQYTAYFTELSDSVFNNDKVTSTMRAEVLNTIGNMQKLTASAVLSIDQAKDSATLTLWIVSSLAFLLGLGVAFLLTANVQKQLGKDPGELVVIAQRVTDGDYAVDDGSRRQGVYGSIVGMVEALKTHIENAHKESARAHEESARAHEAMQKAEIAGKEAQSKAESIQRAAVRLEEVANIVSSAVSELSAQVEQSELGASEQASRVTETATAMEEMNSTVLEVARNASSASEISATTRTKALDGAGVVQQALKSIQVVQEQSMALKEDMRILGDNAQSISQIVGVISDIADQTNLLALNAAIEAARAGEAGRGFAVVADEVRKLAEKTMLSTTDVGQAIAAIQQSAEKSMAQVDETVQNIESATTLAARSGDALAEIVSMVENTADQVRTIATASEQQSATSAEINNSIAQVNSIAAENARAMGEASRAVEKLNSQATVLTGLIDDMRKG